jgi:hypothetical protein
MDRRSSNPRSNSVWNDIQQDGRKNVRLLWQSPFNQFDRSALLFPSAKVIAHVFLHNFECLQVILGLALLIHLVSSFFFSFIFWSIVRTVADHPKHPNWCVQRARSSAPSRRSTSAPTMLRRCAMAACTCSWFGAALFCLDVFLYY